MTGKDMVEARFRWAKQHSETLEAEYASYFTEPKPYGLVVQHDRKYTEYTFRIRIKRSIPDHWPFVIGDIVHNLRSCLDNLAFNLAGSPASEKQARRVQFPILRPGRKSGRAEFYKSAKRMLPSVDDDAITIIEGIQPYHGLRGARPPTGTPAPWPPYPLSVLNQMSNVDKHRAPHVGFATITDVEMRSAIPPTEYVAFSGRLLEDDAVIARYKFPRPVKPNVDVHDPKAGVVVAFEVPWGTRGYKTVSFDWLGFMIGLIEKDILTPLRQYMK